MSPAGPATATAPADSIADSSADSRQGSPSLPPAGRLPTSGRRAAPALPVALAALILVIWFGSLGLRSLVPSDEGRYAEIAREMVSSGDWITPRYNAVKYFEKPPLHLWLSAAAYTAFGVGEWQARLGGALVSLLGSLAIAWSARRWFGSRAACIVAAIVLSAPAWNFGAHFNSLDTTVAGFLACALAAFLLALAPGSSTAARHRWLMACWAAMALATMTKGLIGVVLPALALGSYCLLSGQWRLLTRLDWLRGASLFLAIAAPWFIVVSLRNPEFAHFFFIHEHLQRYTSTIHSREGAPWYFLPIIVAGLLPWTTLTPWTKYWRGRKVWPWSSTRSSARAAAWKTSRGWRGTEACGQDTIAGPQAGDHADPLQAAHQLRPLLLAACWAISILGFFSLSSSKLPGYILPVLPALALIAGVIIARNGLWGWRWQLPLLALLCLGLGAAAPALSTGLLSNPNQAGMTAGMTGCLIAAALLGGLGLGLSWLLLRRQASVAAVLALALTTLLTTSTLMAAYESLGRQRAGVDLARAIEHQLTPATALYSVRRLDHTLPFYLRRPMTLVESADELAFGLAQEPERWLPTLDQFLVRWQDGSPAIAVMTPETLEVLRQRGAPMTEIGRDARRVAVSNRAQGPGDRP